MPGVLWGVVLMLVLSRTTLNIQSFMGAIMAVGISVANSILLVTFAEQALQHRDAETAAHTGAVGRLRAILMTASSMIYSMIPMPIGFAEGGAQSAPLARAVMRRLLFSSIPTFPLPPPLHRHPPP